MCLFITVLLPEDANLEELKPIYSKYLMNFVLDESKTVLSELRPNDKSYNPGLHVHCDCATSLGGVFRGKQSESRRQEIIERARRETPEPFIREEGIKAKLNEKEGPGFDVPHWMGFLHESLDKDLVKHIGLFLHWGDLYEQGRPRGKEERKRYKLWKKGEIRYDPAWYKPLQIEIKGERRVPLRDLTVDLLVQMEEDVLAEFVR